MPSLLTRSLQRQWRVAVLCSTAEYCVKLDNFLWSFSDSSFLPHGMDTDIYPQEQPILVTVNGENHNQAHVCFCVEGAMTANPQNYKRVCILFNDHNFEHLSIARSLWKNLKAEQGLYELSYWKQNPRGAWEKKG